MNRRVRKLIGTVVILLFVSIYALVVVAVAQGRIQEAPGYAQLLFYVVAGLAWVLPLLPLIKWMERADHA